VNFNLSPAEARVLGCLIEKEITTPDYYPLSLNALQNAANQKSNREPVMDLDEESIRRALHSLSDQQLARSAATDSRVPKYEHRLADVFNFHRHETALICVLLLRGPQTPGELRGRTERIHRFEHLDEVLSAMQRLMQREPPLARVLPRQPGTKESRYMHLLSGGGDDAGEPTDRGSQTPSSVTGTSPPESSRITRLEEDVVGLREEIAGLKQQMESFRKQFE
jgi:uncharacterized protein